MTFFLGVTKPGKNTKKPERLPEALRLMKWCDHKIS